MISVVCVRANVHTLAKVIYRSAVSLEILLLKLPRLLRLGLHTFGLKAPILTKLKLLLEKGYIFVRKKTHQDPHTVSHRSYLSQSPPLPNGHGKQSKL